MGENMIARGRRHSRKPRFVDDGLPEHTDHVLAVVLVIEAVLRVAKRMRYLDAATIVGWGTVS